MIFSSIPFLFYFLPVVLLVYFLVPFQAKNVVLLVASLIFYGWGEPGFLFVMIFTILQGYIFGQVIASVKGRQKKFFLAVSVFLSLGILVSCKYADFFLANINAVTGASLSLLHIALPIGISFYTFQILSYTLDVYNGKVEAQKNMIKLATYIAMFPQLIAGPIIRYQTIEKQISGRTHTIDKCAWGIRRFVVGLAKKVLIANVLGEIVASFKTSADLSVLYVWIYIAACTLQIYFDFSGYSDMAIGLGKIFGFDFGENFHYPLTSRSITEFWRRWHISLGAWFRDYVYIPLGGNRVSRVKWLRNVLLVWFLTGFWHGASWNFIFWGLYFGIFLVVEKFWIGDFLKKTKWICHIYVVLLVTISFLLFDITSMTEVVRTFGALFGMGDYPLLSVESLYCLKSYGMILFISILGSTPLPSNIVKKMKQTIRGEKIVNIAEPIVLLLLIIIVTGFLVDGSFNPFLYFRF